MNIEKNQAEKDELRQHAAAEVIELGQMLFDITIDAAAQPPARHEEIDASLIEDMRAAVAEFFTALGLLLETDRQSIPDQLPALKPQIPLKRDKRDI